MAANFALTPGLIGQNVLDYRNSDNRKLYKEATKQLAEENFDCDESSLLQFLKDLEDRAAEYGWNAEGGILSVDTNPNDEEAEEESLLDNYGSLSLETIRRAEQQYVFTQTRAAQDNAMLYKCLMSSLTKAAKQKVIVNENEYTIENNEGEKRKSGVLLLKVIVRESHIDTNATTSQIRLKLSSLDEYMKKIESNIPTFNQHVKLLVQALKARKQTTEDLLINLFKGYAAASDQNFREYISRKQDLHDEGNTVSPSDLMTAAKNKYDILVEREQWNSPTADEKLVVLETKIESMKKDLKRKLESRAKFAKPEEGEKGHQGKAKEFNQNPRNWPKPQLGKDPVKRKWKGKMYRYCHPKTGGKCDGKWVRHSAEQCRGIAGKRKEGPEIDKTSQRKLKVARALAARIVDTDESE